MKYQSITVDVVYETGSGIWQQSEGLLVDDEIINQIELVTKIQAYLIAKSERLKGKAFVSFKLRKNRSVIGPDNTVLDIKREV